MTLATALRNLAALLASAGLVGLATVVRSSAELRVSILVLAGAGVFLFAALANREALRARGRWRAVGQVAATGLLYALAIALGWLAAGLPATGP